MSNMTKAAEILFSEIVEIPRCPGFGILLGGDKANHAYVRALAERAELDCGHPWVRAERTDGRLLGLIKAHWAACKPGWLTRCGDVAKPDDQIVALHAHSAISHHMPHGCVLLTPDQLAAVRLLQVQPELAEREIMAYRGYTDIPQSATVLDLVLTPGSDVLSSRLALDHDAFDNDIERYDRVAAHGKSVVKALLAGEL